jgi:hypothetical protein
MSKEEVSELKKFIQPYPRQVQELALWLRDFVWGLYPNGNELIYDNYNAVAFGWSLTEKLSHTFCSIALMPRYVHFGFYWGSEISDPEKKLLGKGNQYRYVIVSNKEEFPKAYIKKLLKEAYANSLAKVKNKAEIKKGLTIIKSISPVKKRPAPIAAKKKD